MIDIAPQLDRHVVLGGIMGAGKSTVGPLLGRRLGLPSQDLDETIVSRAGRPIPEIFERDGEPAFRKLEATVLAEALAGAPSVLAVGGGTLCRESAWAALRSAGALTVVLEADPGVLADRTRNGDRPLLAGATGADLRARLASLAHERDRWYRRADLTVDTGGRSPDAVAGGLAEALRDLARSTVPVRLGDRSYTVRVVPGGLEDLGAHVARRLPPGGAAGTVGVVTDEIVAGHHLAACETSLEGAGYRVVEVTFPAGEATKHLGTVTAVLDGLLEGGLQRGSPVVALGGGVVGDVGGFAASVLYRGGPVVQVPTTLLAMVDAAIGGKTGVDHRLGKNLVGTFHQPLLVYAALGVLGTLPDRDFRAGLGEVVKYALLEEGGAFLEWLEAEADAVLARDEAALLEVVATCARHKARVVEADEVEGGARRRLNLGHTLGHALEAHTGYETWRHGEAVAMGLVAAVRVGRALGRTPASLEARLTRLLERLGLPADPAPLFDPEVVAKAAYDKKRVGDLIQFVVPVESGGVEIVPLSLQDLKSVPISRGDG